MPWSPLPTPDHRGDPDPVAVPELLDAVLAGLGGSSVAAVVLVHERWDELVGPEVAARCRPAGLEDGVLRIDADSAAWASHLRWSEQEIAARADALLGAGSVRAVVVRVARR